MTKPRSRFTVVATACLLFGAVFGCSGSAPKRNATGGSGGEEDTAGAGGESSGGSGGSTGGAGGKSTGGAGGSAAGAGGSTGGAGDATGGSGGASGGSGGTGGTGAMGGSAGDGTGGSGGDATGGAGGVGPDGGTSMTGILACWPDPKVIKICHQLENACENCGPMKATAPPKNKQAAACFDLIDKAYAGMATDADCEKFAMMNDCTVDNASTTGNICGSLNCDLPACKCTTPGCDSEANKGKTCAADQHWGDASGCMKWVTKCPCQ